MKILFEKNCHNNKSINRIIFSPNNDFLTSCAHELPNAQTKNINPGGEIKIWSIDKDNFHIYNLAEFSTIPFIHDIIYSNNGESLISINNGGIRIVSDLNNFSNNKYPYPDFLDGNNNNDCSLTNIKDSTFINIISGSKSMLWCKDFSEEMNIYVKKWKNIYLAKLKDKITKRCEIWAPGNELNARKDKRSVV